MTIDDDRCGKCRIEYTMAENGTNGAGSGAGLITAPRSGEAADDGTTQKATWRTKVGLAEMLKGGVIMDVVTPEQARIAEEAGAAAVMGLERGPGDIRPAGGVVR